VDDHLASNADFYPDIAYLLRAVFRIEKIKKLFMLYYNSSEKN